VKPLFTLGHVVATPGALAALEKAGQQPVDFLARNANGDWGEVPPEDSKENQFSLNHGFRLLSAYRSCHTRGIDERETKASTPSTFFSMLAQVESTTLMCCGLRLTTAISVH